MKVKNDYNKLRKKNETLTRNDFYFFKIPGQILTRLESIIIEFYTKRNTSNPNRTQITGINLYYIQNVRVQRVSWWSAYLVPAPPQQHTYLLFNTTFLKVNFKRLVMDFDDEVPNAERIE